MLTQTAKYAIRALVHLAQQDPDLFCQTRDIAQTINVPSNYLGKTLQKLSTYRILDSQKGVHGGFRVARPADRISLYEIMIAVEAIPKDMADDLSMYDSELPSDVYLRLGEISGIYSQFLQETTLADLLPYPAEIEQVSPSAAAT